MQEGREQSWPGEHEDRGMFMQELLMSTLSGELELSQTSQDPSSLLEALRSPSQEEEQEETGQPQPQPESRSPATEAPKVGGGPAGAKTVAPRPADRGPSVPKPPSSGGSARVGSGSGSGGARPVPAPATHASTLASSASGHLAASGVGSGGGVVNYPPQGRMASPREGRESREGRVNPASAKRNMLKHNIQPTGTSDTEPPPH